MALRGQIQLTLVLVPLREESGLLQRAADGLPTSILGESLYRLIDVQLLNYKY